MIEFTLRHPLNCTPERHWEMFFDPQWTEDLLTDGLGFSCDVGPVRTEGGMRHRDMQVAPVLDLPKAVAKLFSDTLGYVEQGKFDEDKKQWSYTLRLNVLSEKIKLGGDVTLEPLGDDRCTRVSKMWAEAKIFGVGGLIEKAAEKNMRDGWGKSADWINAWIAKNPA